MTEWFKDWFSSEDYLEVYQHRNYEDANKLVDLIIAHCRPGANDSILDAACGAGRHAIAFKLKGFNVVGFDLSKKLLFNALENCKQESVKINLVCGDLRNIYFKKKFDLITNLFTSFGYFESDEENFKFIKNAYDFLNPNKYYVLDYLNEEYIRSKLKRESYKEIKGKKITERRKIIKDYIQKKITIEEHGKVKEFVEQVKMYSKEKLVDGFHKIGYKLDKIYGDYNCTLYDRYNSPRAILFFKK